MPYFTIPTLHDYQTMATPFFIWFSFTDVVAFSAFSKISYKNALLFKTIVIQYLPQYTSYEETTADNLCNNISLSKNQYNFELRLDIVNARIDSCFFSLILMSSQASDLVRKIRVRDVIQYVQSFSSYFETFWCFTKFSFHNQWNDVRYYLCTWYIAAASPVAEQLTT